MRAILIFSYIVMCLIYGTTYIAIKIGIDHGVPPFLLAGTRFLLASLLILAYFSVFKRTRTEVKLYDYLYIAWLGLLMTAIPFAILFWSEQFVSSGIAALLGSTAPIFIAILERSRKVIQWVGISIALLGLCCIIYPDIRSIHVSKMSLVGDIMVVISEFFFAYGVIRSKKVIAKGVPSLLFNALQMFFASIVLIALSFFAESPLQTKWSSVGLASLFYMAILVSILASGIYYWLIHKTNPLFPTTWTYVSPIIAMYIGYVALHEQITYFSSLGAFLVICGVLLINSNLVVSIAQAVIRQKRSANC